MVFSVSLSAHGCSIRRLLPQDTFVASFGLFSVWHLFELRGDS